MRPTRLLFGGLVALFFLASSAHAETPNPALRYVPENADLVFHIKNPRELWDAALSFEVVQQGLKLDTTREFLDSTPIRRIKQVLGYFEKELGADALTLLDQLAGNGVTIAVKIGSGNQPVLAVIRAKDEKVLRRFVEVALDVVRQELDRQEVKVKPIVEKYKGVETTRIGNDVSLAIIGDMLLIANKTERLHQAIDAGASDAKGKSLADNPHLADAVKLLPPNPLATLWINLEPARKLPGLEMLVKTPRDPFFTIVAGSTLDVVSRSPYLAVGLYKEEKGLLLTVRMPRGKEGMGPDRAVNIPPDDQPGTRPLLQPKNTLLSTSFYTDLSHFWNDRVKLLGEATAKEFDKAESDVGKYLSNISIAKLLNWAGPYHRLVVVNQPKSGYKRQPLVQAQSFAYVLEMRDPEQFGRSMETILRTVALFAGAQFKLKLAEEEHSGVKLIGYRFPEDREVAEDPTGLRFGFSPCFARVGNQFMAASTIELGREMIDLLKTENKKVESTPATARTAFYSSGLRGQLESVQEQLVSAIVLARAVTIDEAKAEMEAILKLVDSTGGATLTTTYGPNSFAFDVRINLKK